MRSTFEKRWTSCIFNCSFNYESNHENFRIFAEKSLCTLSIFLSFTHVIPLEKALWIISILLQSSHILRFTRTATELARLLHSHIAQAYSSSINNAASLLEWLEMWGWPYWKWGVDWGVSDKTDWSWLLLNFLELNNEFKLNLFCKSIELCLRYGILRADLIAKPFA